MLIVSIRLPRYQEKLHNFQKLASDTGYYRYYHPHVQKVWSFEQLNHNEPNFLHPKGTLNYMYHFKLHVINMTVSHVTHLTLLTWLSYFNTWTEVFSHWNFGFKQKYIGVTTYTMLLRGANQQQKIMYLWMLCVRFHAFSWCCFNNL